MDLTEEQLARVFTNFIFSDTPIADYHGERGVMDEYCYAVVREAVAANLRRIARNHKLLADPQAAEEMRPSRAMEFFRYRESFSYSMSKRSELDGERPTFLGTEPPKDKADFLLSGAFKDGCERGIRVDDETMRRIDKDILDRVYTLMRLRLLPLPKGHLKEKSMTWGGKS